MGSSGMCCTGCVNAAQVIKLPREALGTLYHVGADAVLARGDQRHRVRAAPVL
jgi:hypothetical protein